MPESDRPRIPIKTDRRRKYDPFVASCCVLCLICVVITIVVGTTVLDTKGRVDDTACAQIESYEANMNREARLAVTDAPDTRSAHRQSVRAFRQLLEDIRPLVDCPD